jgi:putative transposase
LRCDALHKLTTSLATQHGNVVVEQLNVAGMLRNRRLARVLSDTGMAELRRQLGYKAIWYGCRLVVADPFYPSSKRCSACGWVKAKLTLAERTFTCEACGLRIDRDLNAARNLAKLVQSVAQSGWETQTASRKAGLPTEHLAPTLTDQVTAHGNRLNQTRDMAAPATRKSRPVAAKTTVISCFSLTKPILEPSWR